MEVEKKTHKLTHPQRMQVLAMLARGDNSTQINTFLQERYGVQLTPSMYTIMRKKHAETIQAMQDTIQHHAALEAEVLMNKSRKILNKKLDRADRDTDTLDELDEQYRNGDIPTDVYKRKKATLMKITVAELNMVSKEMHNQSVSASSDRDEGSGNADPGASQALLDAIRRNDTVELQRIILRPQE